jgi:hypothetical protein
MEPMTVIISQEAVLYFKVFTWVLGGLFGLFGAVLGMLVWLVIRIVHRNDNAHNDLWNTVNPLKASHEHLLGEHEIRGSICPALHPELRFNLIRPNQSSTLKKEEDLNP